MGLLHLREFQNFFVFSSAGVQRILTSQNRIFKVLERANPPVRWHTLSPSGRLAIHRSENPSESATFICHTIALGGSFPDFASGQPRGALSTNDANLGILFEQAGKKFFVAPTIPGRDSKWMKLAASADVLLLDGTFWSDDELRATGRSNRSAREIGHLPLSGSDGLLSTFPASVHGRKILTHINNTNPILDEDSPEHRAVLEAGFEIAYDGMSIEL